MIISFWFLLTSDTRQHLSSRYVCVKYNCKVFVTLDRRPTLAIISVGVIDLRSAGACVPLHEQSVCGRPLPRNWPRLSVQWEESFVHTQHICCQLIWLVLPWIWENFSHIDGYIALMDYTIIHRWYKNTFRDTQYITRYSNGDLIFQYWLILYRIFDI